MLRVHYLAEDREPAPRILQEQMGEIVLITSGNDLPALSDFEILVTGFPERRHLEASPYLRALIVPFAGAPAATVALLRDFPAVTLHNVPPFVQGYSMPVIFMYILATVFVIMLMLSIIKEVRK